MTPLVALLAFLACYRLTLLVCADTITEPLRSRLIGWAYRRAHASAPERPSHTSGRLATWDEFARRDPEAPTLVAGLLCPWCASVWLAGPVAWSAWCFAERAWWMVPALALAASGAAGFLAEHASPGE